MVDDIFDPKKARDARDAGMDSVKVNNPDFSYWYFQFVLLRLPVNWIGTNEFIRQNWPAHWPLPKHHNAWGSNCGSMIRKGLLERLDEQVPMGFRKSHARKTNLLRRVRPRNKVPFGA